MPPRLRMAILILFALAAPLSVTAGSLGVGLIGAAAAVTLVRGGRAARQALPRRVLWALGAAVAVNALAAALAFPHPAHWGKLLDEWWIKLLLPAVPLAAVGLDRRALQGVLAAALGAGLLAAAYGIVQHFLGWDYVRDRELFRAGASYLAVGTAGHHLTFGGQLLLYLTLAMAAAARHVRGLRRGLLWSLPAAGVTGLALLWTYARSCYLGACAAAVALAALAFRSRRVAATVALAVLAAAAVLSVSVPGVRARLGETFADDREVTRTNLWRSSLAGIAARPLLGWGPGNFDALMAAHEHPGYYEAKAHAHNDYLMQAVNAGLPGLAAFLWLQWEILRALRRGRRTTADQDWVVPAALACLAAMAAAGLFQVYQTDDEPEMLLYFILGCGLAAAAPRRA